MRRTLPLLLPLLAAASAIADGPTRIQRRADDEPPRNAVGELTYSVDRDHAAAVLRVGTSDAGTVVVSDPWAIHVAPRRRLAEGEYGVSVTGDYTVYADGSILLATNVVSGVVTNTVVIRPVDPAVRLAGVTWDLAGRGIRGDRTANDRVADEYSATLTVRTTYDQEPSLGSGGPTIVPGWALLRGVTVWAWEGDRRAETLDCELAPVPIRDSMGHTSLWNLRRWICDRYDGRAGDDWSLYPATNTVHLAGQTVLWSAGGSLRSQVESGGAWTYYASGIPVIRVVSGVSGSTPEIDLAAIALEGTNAVIDVVASLGVPVYIESCSDLESGEWTRASGQTSTYPATVVSGSTVAYRVTVPLDPAASACFYRATATIEGDGESRALHLGGEGTALYISGLRCAWTNITVNGSALRVLAVQE